MEEKFIQIEPEKQYNKTQVFSQSNPVSKSSDKLKLFNFFVPGKRKKSDLPKSYLENEIYKSKRDINKLFPLDFYELKIGKKKVSGIDDN